MTAEPSPRPWHFNGMRPTIYSDENLPDGSARVVLDIETDHLPLLPCDENDRRLIADLALIVDAVNQRDRLRAELDALQTSYNELHSTLADKARNYDDVISYHMRSEEKLRDALREIIRKIGSENYANDDGVDPVDILEIARAAIGEGEK